jgi:hypothetical protein
MEGRSSFMATPAGSRRPRPTVATSPSTMGVPIGSGAEHDLGQVFGALGRHRRAEQVLPLAETQIPARHVAQLGPHPACHVRHGEPAGGQLPHVEVHVHLRVPPADEQRARHPGHALDARDDPFLRPGAVGARVSPSGAVMVSTASGGPEGLEVVTTGRRAPAG